MACLSRTKYGLLYCLAVQHIDHCTAWLHNTWTVVLHGCTTYRFVYCLSKNNWTVILPRCTTHGLLYCLVGLLYCPAVQYMDYCTARLYCLWTTLLLAPSQKSSAPSPLPCACTWVTHTHQGWVGAQPCHDIAAASCVALIQGTARPGWAGGAGARLAGVAVGAWVTITAGLAIRLGEDRQWQSIGGVRVLSQHNQRPTQSHSLKLFNRHSNRLNRLNRHNQLPTDTQHQTHTFTP